MFLEGCSLDKVHAVPCQQRLCSTAEGRSAAVRVLVKAVRGAR